MTKDEIIDAIRKYVSDSKGSDEELIDDLEEIIDVAESYVDSMMDDPAASDDEDK